MSDAFRIEYIGNVVDCRTEAEVSLRHPLTDSDPLCAVVYENESGPVVEWFAVAKESDPSPGLVDAIEVAKRGLLTYVNRRGVNPPGGLTPAGLSLWLLERADRTAMGTTLPPGT